MNKKQKNKKLCDPFCDVGHPERSKTKGKFGHTLNIDYVHKTFHIFPILEKSNYTLIP